MAISRLTRPDAVLAAIQEFNSLGREPFLRKYGFGKARKFLISHEGREYDSKAIVGVAFGYQFPKEGPLKAEQFAGGEATVRPVLEGLGFRVITHGDVQPDAELAPAGKHDHIIAQHATAPFYSDHPARRDLLNRKAVADTIATMVKSVWREDGKEEAAESTFMVHLHGRWGSGKTSILNFLKDALIARQSSEAGLRPSAAAAWVIVDYNAWRKQNLGPAWWTLMETVYQQARDELGGWLQPKGRLLIVRDRWWRVRSSYAPYAAASILVASLGLWLIWQWRVYLFQSEAPWLGEGLKVLAVITGLIAAVFAFGHSHQIRSARTAKSYLELSRDPLGPLTKHYDQLVADIGRPVAVFIDDLDRCSAEFVVELLQTIQTMFRGAKVLYVVAADRDWVCASYEQQYRIFSDSLGEPGKSLGHLFLEKVFQLSIEVPRLDGNERSEYWSRLLNPVEPAKPEQTKEIAEAIGVELSNAKTEGEVSAILERYRDDPIRANIAAAGAFQRMQSAPLVREREHFLAKYADLIEANPRAMKRLLNAYGFRRGFDILSGRRSDPDAMVRWTILENRWPILADYLEGRSGGRVQPEIIRALMNDAQVREVANGLTWQKLRPLASAPDRPPAPEITPGADTKTKSQSAPRLD